MKKHLRFLLIAFFVGILCAADISLYANVTTGSTCANKNNKGDDTNCDNPTKSNSNGGSDDSKKKDDKDCGCDNGDSGNAGPGSLKVEIPFGRTINEPMIPDGQFLIHKERASLSVFSPQGLFYSHNLVIGIISDVTSGLPSGIAREVMTADDQAYQLKYQFKTGESLGYPVGESMNSVTRLRMTDANGNAVTSDPVYYELISGANSMLKISVATKMPVSITTPNGRLLLPASPGIQIDAIYDDAYCLRQVWSGADGLADIVVIDDNSYEIRLYSSDSVGAKTNGLYTINTGALPHTKWIIAKPSGYTGIDKVLVTKVVGSTNYETLFEYSSNDDEWTMTKGNGLRKVTKYLAWNEAQTDCLETKVVTDNSAAVSYKETIKKHIYNFGKAVAEETVDPDGAALKTQYTYYENSSESGYGRRKTIKEADGSWASYQYDSQGRLTVMVESYKDAAFNASASSAKATYYSYDPVDSADTAVTNDRRRRVAEVKINGISVSKTYYAYKTVSGENIYIEERASSPSAAYGASGNFRTVTTSYGSTANAASVGRVKTIEYADGLLDTYTYEYGTYTPSATPGSSSFTAGSGNAFRRTIVHGTTSSPSGVACKTTRDIQVTDEFGNDVMTESYIYTGSGYERASWLVSVFDGQHHITHQYTSNNTEYSATWNCCDKESQTNSDGSEYTFAYDLIQRIAGKTKKGYNGTSDVVTTYAYDSSSRVVSEAVSGGALSLSSSTGYDDAGRVTSATSVSGLETSFAYQAGGRITTKTYSDGSTVITEDYIDGKTKSVSGTAVVPQFYEYGVNSDGSMWAKVSSGSNSSARWAKTTTDFLGRVIKEESPGYSGTVSTQYYYNSKSQLVKITKTNMADTLYEYDVLGNLVRSGLDVNANGTLDLASADRILDSETQAALESSNWWSVTVNKAYATENDSASTTVNTTKTRLTGFSGSVVSEAKALDIHGNLTGAVVNMDRSTKTVTATVDLPDSSANIVSVATNGLLLSSQGASSLVTTYGYDALGRSTTVTDPRTGTSTTAYYASGTGKTGKVYTFTDAAGSVTTYDYDSSSGRLLSVQNALGKKSYYAYNTRGQLTRQWGETGYPIEKTYDDYAQLTQLKTFRNGTGWNNSTWPADTGAADTTAWAYQEATGLLTAKTFADGKSVGYTYTNDGKLATRAWARLNSGSPLLTTYSYDANTAEMTAIDYADSTPDVSFTYDRLGRTKTVADAVGSRTFSYSNTLQLASETITGLYSKTIARNYDTIGRYNGVNIGTEYDLDYGFDGYGRFNSITNGTDSYTYSYLANSNLIESLTGPNNITKTNTYEAHRNLITNLENKYSSTTISQYLSRYDAIARRTDTVHTGTAFAQANFNKWLYNDRSELVDGKKYAGSDPTDTSDPLTTFDYTFSFDNIGNRITSTTSGTSTSYTSNNRNQYTAVGVENPAYDDDGNMLANGDWAYTWDAENRLVKAEKTTQKLEFTYDYMGRRVEKKVYDKTGSVWTLSKNLRFLYDGYKLIEELDGTNSNALLRKYAWSGETLLSVYDAGNSATYHYFTDANKNVGQLIDNSGNIVAAYEYSPFGQITSKTGAYSDVNPFRFSSEYYDDETNLVYYNHRYYSADLGRWLSRDPIEEEGGYNLYAMLANDTINAWDYLGLEACTGTAVTLVVLDAAIAADIAISNGDPTGIAKAIATLPVILRMMLDDLTAKKAEVDVIKEKLERARDLLREHQNGKNIVDQAFDEFNKKYNDAADDAAKTAADDVDSTTTSSASTNCDKNQADASENTEETQDEETPPRKTKKQIKEEQQEKAKQEKHGDKDWEEPASEEHVKWQAKKLEKSKGKDARRDAHDKKQKGEPDRSRNRIRDDYNGN